MLEQRGLQGLSGQTLHIISIQGIYCKTWILKGLQLYHYHLICTQYFTELVYHFFLKLFDHLGSNFESTLTSVIEEIYPDC